MPVRKNFNANAHKPGSGVNSPLNEKGHTALHLAVEKRDLAAISRLTRVGADPNQPDKEGQTPLFLAIEKQDIETAKMLASNGASFEARDAKKRGPLDWAIEKECKVEFIAELKALGADPAAPMADQRRTAMHLAAEKDRPDLVSYLAETGLSVNQQDGLGATPLHVAVTAKSDKALEKLLELKADATIRNNQIETPLHIAASNGNVNAVDKLLELQEVRRSINDHRTYGQGRTPLMNAAANNHPAIIEKLVAVGASVNQPDSRDRNCLSIAVEMGNVETAKLLVKLGADVGKAADSEGGKSSILHEMGDKNYAEMLVVLHGAGVDLNARDSTGKTPLNKACDDQKKERIEALLKLGADPNIPDDFGHRPLDTLIGHYSFTYSDYDDMVAMLVSRGAEVNLSPSVAIKESPLHFAARAGKINTMKLLAGRGAELDQQDRTDAGLTPFMAACEGGHAGAALFLKDAGANVFGKDAFGRGALHFAARGGANKAIETLLSLPGMDKELDAQDNRGRTPMHHAFRKYHAYTGIELMKKGARVDLLDFEGKTALHQGIETNYQADFLDKAAEILGDKANWNLRTKSGDTLLHAAAQHGQQSAIGKLLSFGADVTLQNDKGETPLMAAVNHNNEMGFSKILEAMKAKDIAPDLHRDKQGDTALHHAVRVAYDVRFMQGLLDAGADIESRNARGETPLIAAVKNGNREFVALLVAKGADIMAKDKDEKTALDLAVAAERIDIAQQLMLALQQKALAEEAQKKIPPQKPQPPNPGAPAP